LKRARAAWGFGMEYGKNDPAINPERGQLLADLVHGRAEMEALLAEAQYDEAIGVGDRLLTRLSGYLPEDWDVEGDLGLLPHFSLGVAMLADTSVAAILAGDNKFAAELLRSAVSYADLIGKGADRLASFGILYCKDGRPSLDGNCIQIPPCTP
jgi:hypothetical protein